MTQAPSPPMGVSFEGMYDKVAPRGVRREYVADNDEYSIWINVCPNGHFLHWDVFRWSHSVLKRMIHDAKQALTEYKDQGIAVWGAADPKHTVAARLVTKVGGRIYYHKLNPNGDGLLAIYRLN